ncbi:MAG: twin-arginine translocase subunit TatC, partial [Muribaculaceae bacterium]|nr:twin-arginine translocase subunit TatC [Muribaculaceae bacterium]
SASLWMAFVLGFPMIIYLLWSFVAPVLYDSEKRGVRRAFVAGNLMFFLGMATGYFLVFPIAVRFLADYSLSDKIRTLVSLDSYMDNFFTLLLLMGAIFELPLLAWLLGKMGFLTRGFFSRYRRHAIVVLLIVAAAVTPTGDPFSLMAVFLPIYALWEFSRRLVPAETAAC